jgi:hypothetical protein
MIVLYQICRLLGNASAALDVVIAMMKPCCPNVSTAIYNQKMIGRPWVFLASVAMISLTLV